MTCIEFFVKVGVKPISNAWLNLLVTITSHAHLPGGSPSGSVYTMPEWRRFERPYIPIRTNFSRLLTLHFSVQPHTGTLRNFWKWPPWPYLIILHWPDLRVVWPWKMRITCMRLILLQSLVTREKYSIVRFSHVESSPRVASLHDTGLCIVCAFFFSVEYYMLLFSWVELLPTSTIIVTPYWWALPRRTWPTPGLALPCATAFLPLRLSSCRPVFHYNTLSVAFL